MHRKKGLLIVLLLTFNLIALSFFLISYNRLTYPLVGHDYRYFMSHLIDALLHYKVNGISIQWYTPSFGGGLPAYPNPQNMQFSLTQLLTYFFNPWNAIEFSMVIYLSIGLVVTFLLLKNILHMNFRSATLGTIFFLGNGFYIQSLVVGHVIFLTFPLVSVALFSLVHPKLPSWCAGALLGLVVAVLGYSGGVHIAIIAVFTLLLSLPLCYLLDSSWWSWKRVVSRILWGSLISVFILFSHVYAIYSFMRFYPRTVQDVYPVTWLEGLGGLILQLFGFMNAAPILVLSGNEPSGIITLLAKWTGSPYSFWELDQSLSPMLLFLLGIGALGFLVTRRRRIPRPLLPKLLAVGVLLFGLVITVEFTLAKGSIFLALRQLPLLSSIRVNSRFAAALILPLSILGARAFDFLLTRLKRPVYGSVSFVLMNTLSLASLWLYFLLPARTQVRNFDPTILLDTYDRISSGETFPVHQVDVDMNDYEVFLAGASNVYRHYDPLIEPAQFISNSQLLTGSVYTITDGFYNLNDPTGFFFPEENGSYAFERIKVADYDKLVDFVNRRQPDWKIPAVQRWADWLSAITFILASLAPVGYWIYRRWRGSKPLG